MFRYFIEDEQQSCPVTLSFVTGQSNALTMRVGNVRLLRNIEYKGQFFAPFLPTTDLLFLFPSCVDLAAGERTRPAAAVCDKISRYLTYLHSEASSCTFALVDIALCTTSGCAMVVLRCCSTMDALQVMSVWGNVEAQDESMRMSSLYIQCFPCDEACTAGGAGPFTDSCPAAVTTSIAKLLETNYLLPTCVLCADRLETVMTGQAADTPTCACASIEGRRCSCLQHSCCIVCQLFLRAQDTSSTKPPVKCQDCGQSGDPWVCMICGYVGCSRYQAMHAKDHCIRHRHFFSMNLLTQQIWDYHSDAFVHRVVMNVDIHAGNAARVQFPDREQPLVEGMEDEDEALAGAGIALGKKCVSAKYDAKLSVSHTQYAILLKNELDAMRAMLAAGHARTSRQCVPSHSTSSEHATRVQEEEDDVDGSGATASQVCTHSVSELDTSEPSFMAVALRALRGVGRAREQLRSEVAAVGYGLRNLRDELYLSRSQGAQLEQEERALAQELRATVRANAEAELKRQGTIADLEATLQEIELNRRAQRQIVERLGSSDGVARMAVLGEGRPAQRSSAGGRRRGGPHKRRG